MELDHKDCEMLLNILNSIKIDGASAREVARLQDKLEAIKNKAPHSPFKAKGVAN